MICIGDTVLVTSNFPLQLKLSYKNKLCNMAITLKFKVFFFFFLFINFSKITETTNNSNDSYTCFI